MSEIPFSSAVIISGHALNLGGLIGSGQKFASVEPDWVADDPDSGSVSDFSISCATLGAILVTSFSMRDLAPYKPFLSPLTTASSVMPNPCTETPAGFEIDQLSFGI